MANDIKINWRQRIELTARLYEVTAGSELVPVNLWELGEELGFSHSEVDDVDEFLSKHDLIEHIVSGGTVRLTAKGAIETKLIAVQKLMGDLRRQLPELKLDGEACQTVVGDIIDVEGETKYYDADFNAVEKHLSSTRTVLERLADNPIAMLLIQQIDVLKKKISA